MANDGEPQEQQYNYILNNEKDYIIDEMPDYSDKISFLTSGKIIEELENVVSNIEKIRDTSSFHFEGEAGNEPAGKYQDACTQLIGYVDKLKDFLQVIHNGLNSEFENVKIEIDNSFSWYGCHCEKKPVEQKPAEEN